MCQECRAEKGKKNQICQECRAEKGEKNQICQECRERTKDYMVRYYQTHPRANEGLVTLETADAGFRAGCEEWFNMNDTKKTEWMEDYNNMIAEGKSLFILRKEYRHRYIH